MMKIWPNVQASRSPTPQPPAPGQPAPRNGHLSRSLIWPPPLPPTLRLAQESELPLWFRHLYAAAVIEEVQIATEGLAESRFLECPFSTMERESRLAATRDCRYENFRNPRPAATSPSHPPSKSPRAFPGT